MPLCRPDFRVVLLRRISVSGSVVVMFLTLPPEVLAHVCGFLDPVSLLESRTVCKLLGNVATNAAESSLHLRVRVKEARHTFCLLQLLPAFIGILLLGSQVSILVACIPRRRQHGVVSPVPFELAIVGTLAYVVMYLLWTFWVCGFLRLRRRMLLGISILLCVVCLTCAIAGCAQTHNEKVKMALILPGPFGFAFISFWAAFWDTDASRHASRQPTLRKRRTPTPTNTYGTFGNAGVWYGQIWVA